MSHFLKNGEIGLICVFCILGKIKVNLSGKSKEVIIIFLNIIITYIKQIYVTCFEVRSK